MSCHDLPRSGVARRPVAKPALAAIGGPLAVRFVPRPAGHCLRVLGVTISQARAHEPLNFSVPAHVLATLNVVLNGTLSHRQTDLPRSFATGCHTRSRRYTLSPGSVLLSLLCRADVLADLSGEEAARFTDAWVPSQDVFKAWPLRFAQDPHAHAVDTLAIAKSMLDCVAPGHLAPLAGADESGTLPATRLRAALHALADHPAGAVAKRLHMSERGLQRLFLSQWGINPKRVQRMLRIQRAVALWDARPCGLADLAAQAGLVDQAHLAREFRQLVGYPPSSLKSSPEPASDVRATDALWALRTGGTLLPLLMQ